MNRIRVIASLMFAGWMILTPCSTRAEDFSTIGFTPAQFAEYEQQLNAILRTSRAEEREYISNLVAQVRIGTLPSKLIATSFHWVKTKRPDTNYPFIYFERVLRLQAGKIGLEAQVPPFDFSIYGSAGQRAPGQNRSAGQNVVERRGLFKFQFGRN